MVNPVNSVRSGLKRGFAAFNKATTFEGRVFLATLVALMALVPAFIVYDAIEQYRTNHISPAEHLRIARELCHGLTILSCDAAEAIRNLEKIPPSAPEHAEASKLHSMIQEKQRAVQQQQYEKHRAEIERLSGQSEEESRQQMVRNIRGEAHDTFVCLSSEPKISFDYGHYWWPDDGRCASEQAKQRESEQKQRDLAAESSSNVPTTLRVETDIDSSWLQNEMRTCRTYPDVNRRVARVVCHASGSHQQHNIPITFWGGVDRNAVSDWKCTREGAREGGLSERLDTWLSGYSAEFVCRAID